MLQSMGLQRVGHDWATELIHTYTDTHFVSLWTVTHQDLLFMEFSRQEYWSGLPCSPPGGLSNSGIKPSSLMSPILASRFSTTSATWEAAFVGEGVAIQLTQTLLLGRPQTLQTGTTFREQNLAIPNKSAYAFTLQPIQPFLGTILKIFSNNSKIYAYKVIH